MTGYLHRIRTGVARRTRPLRETLAGSGFSARAVLAARPAVAYISDGAGWVLDMIGQQVARQIGDRCLMQVKTGYRGYRNVLLHFAAPPIYLKQKAYEVVHPSNRVILTWTHGLPGNPDPNIQLQLDLLHEGEPHLERIHVATSTARDFLFGEGISPDKIVHIPFGVDTVLFHPPSPAARAEARKRLSIPENAVCIGSFQKDSPGWDNTSTAIKWVKGPDVLADVLERLAERYPIYVLLTTPSRGYVVNRLQGAGIPYRQDILAGADQLQSYYHALDLYLITSRDEGGPMALLEAMSSGVPVVSTRMGIPRDAIRHAENGMLCEVEDVDGLTHAASRLIESPEFAAKIVEEARRTALAYDWPLIADKYARLLYNLQLKP